MGVVEGEQKGGAWTTPAEGPAKGWAAEAIHDRRARFPPARAPVLPCQRPRLGAARAHDRDPRSSADTAAASNGSLDALPARAQRLARYPRERLRPGFWEAEGKQGTGIAQLQGNIPHMQRVGIGPSSARWSKNPPPGWDTDFGGLAVSGGSKHAELHWLCCPPIQLTEGRCF